jgi:hypothetical protein
LGTLGEGGGGGGVAEWYHNRLMPSVTNTQ